METTLQTVQAIAPHINFEWGKDGQIGVFEIRTVSRDAFDAWFQVMLELMDTWPVDRPLLTVQDNNFPGAAFTPSLREHSKHIANHRPELTMHTAVILPKTLVVQFVEFFLRTVQKPNRQTRIFFSREDAITWLMTKV